jgi:dienelactone hydrolase
MTVSGARVLSGFLAVVLHGAACMSLGFTLAMPWWLSRSRPVLELDLREVVSVEPAQAPAPPPSSNIVEVRKRAPATPAPPVARPAPPPPPEAARAKASVRRTPPAPPRPLKPAPPVVAPAAAPPQPISEHKTEAPPRNADPELEEFAQSGGYVHPEAPDYLRHGAESRFGHVLGYYTYTIEQYVGQYTYDDGQSSVTIIDARDTPYKCLLFYDSKTGIFRNLKQFGRYIYSYGPAFGEDEPVVGTIIFLANGDDISRVIWMHGGRQAAQFPNKIFFSERAVTFSRGFTDLSGTLILPPGEGPFPAVVWLAGSQCRPRKLSEGVARQLVAQNVAVLLFDPRGCGTSEGKSGGDADLAEDALAAVAFLRRQERIDPKRVGIFGRDEGVSAALDACRAGRKAPNFLVQAVVAQDAAPRPAVLSESALRALSIPSLWLFSGPDPRRIWSEDLALLESAPPYGLARVLLLPEEDTPPEDAPAWARDAVRLERMTSGFARFAGPWIGER